MSRARAAVARVLDTVRDSGVRWTALPVADRVVPGGVLRLWRDVTVSAETLETQVLSLLRAWGMDEQAATVTARHVLYADLHGIDSHGCAMLRAYHRDLLAGLWDPRARVAVVADDGATALLDGGGGLGHVPAEAAMKLAIAKCATHGVGAVAVPQLAGYAFALADGAGVSTTAAVVP